MSISIRDPVSGVLADVVSVGVGSNGLLVSIGALALPTGAATEATLTSILTALSGSLTASVSGTVNIGNFPAIQPISAAALPLPVGAATQATLAGVLSALQGLLAATIGGTVSVSNFPVTQSISGTVNIGNFPANQAVTGVFWQATQPISAAALPLPTGAATETTLNSIKTLLSGTLTVGGSVSVSNFPATQLVSGTFWQATQPISAAALPLPTGAATQTTLAAILAALVGTLTVGGTIAVSNFPATQPISATVLPLPTGASTEATVAAMSAKLPASLGSKTGAASLSIVLASDQATIAVSAASLPLPAGAATDSTLSTMSSKLPASVGQKAMVASLPVVLASDQSAVPISAAALPLPAGAATQATLASILTALQGTLSVSDLDTGTVGAASPTIAAQVGGTDGTNLRPLSVTAKGTQGSFAVATQDLKDSGRTYVTFTIDAIVGVATEALANFTQNKGGTVTSGVSSYTVTAGHTLRITSVIVTVRASSTTAVFGRVRVRSGSTVSASSGILVNIDVPALTGTAAAGTGQGREISIPDGIEVAAGQQVGISQIVNSTSSLVSVCVIGYEY